MQGNVRSELCREGRPVVRIPREEDGPLQRGSSGMVDELSNSQSEAVLQSLKAMGYADGLQTGEQE